MKVGASRTRSYFMCMIVTESDYKANQAVYKIWHESIEITK